MSLAACISRWPSTTRSPWLLEARSARRSGSSTDALGLLDLEEERIAVVAAEQQHDPGAGADAADPDDLEGGVDEAVAVEQRAAVARQSVSR